MGAGLGAAGAVGLQPVLEQWLGPMATRQAEPIAVAVVLLALAAARFLPFWCPLCADHHTDAQRVVGLGQHMTRNVTLYETARGRSRDEPQALDLAKPPVELVPTDENVRQVTFARLPDSSAPSPASQ